MDDLDTFTIITDNFVTILNIIKRTSPKLSITHTGHSDHKIGRCQNNIMYLVNQREVRPIDHQQYTTKLLFALFFLLKWYLSIINYLVQYYELHVLVDLQYSQLIEITPNIISTTYFTMKLPLLFEM